MMKSLLFCTVFLLSLKSVIPQFGIGSMQTVAARGVLMCGNRPLTNTVVKLWDEDDGLDPDEELATVRTDSRGRFEVQGSSREISNIDPRLKVYHDCDDQMMPCQRKVKWTIPDKYISKGSRATNVFDIGTVNMEIVFKSEERDCIN